MVGIILAAGSGSRLGEAFGKELCKPLVKIAGKHLIEYSLENLFALNVERIYIVVGRHRESIEQKIGGAYNGVPVNYVVQENPVGLVNAIAAAAEYIDDDAVLQLSDEIFINPDTARLADELKKGADIICGVTTEDNPEKIKANYSVEVNGNGELTSCTEKPRVVNNRLKGTGFCAFSRESVKTLVREYDGAMNVPNDLCDFINILIKRGRRGIAVEIAEKEYNINTAEDAAVANKELERKAAENE